MITSWFTRMLGRCCRCSKPKYHRHEAFVEGNSLENNSNFLHFLCCLFMPCQCFSRSSFWWKHMTELPSRPPSKLVCPLVFSLGQYCKWYSSQLMQNDLVPTNLSCRQIGVYVLFSSGSIFGGSTGGNLFGGKRVRAAKDLVMPLSLSRRWRKTVNPSDIGCNSGRVVEPMIDTERSQQGK